MNSPKDTDKPTFFVSRRGKQIGVHEVDLSGIDIENESRNENPATITKSTQMSVVDQEPKPQKRTVGSKPRFVWSRRKLLTGLGVILVILSLPVFMGELVAAQYAEGARSSRKELDKLIETQVLPMQKKKSFMAADVRRVGEDIDAIANSMCRGGLLDNIASLYPKAKKSLQECSRTQASYMTLMGTIYAIETQIKYLENVNKQLEPISTPLTDEFAVIDDQESKWNSVVDGLKKLSVPEIMGPAHAELTEHASSIIDNWKKLNAANAAQDNAAFLQAEQKLASEYEALRSVSSLYESTIVDAQTKLTASYASLR